MGTFHKPNFRSVQDCLPENSGFEGEINSHYGALTDWLQDLPTHLQSQEAELIFRMRNQVFILPDPLDPTASPLCIKAFRKPGLFRALAYRHQGSKAQRAHTNAVHLYQNDAGVPEPIGYMERWEGSALVESYLISRYLENATDLFTEMTHIIRDEPTAARFIELLRFSARALRDMHDSGFLHNDLGAQNFLMRRGADNQWHDPMLIDLNRGRIKASVSLKERAQDLARLQIPSHFLKIFYHIYFDDMAIPAEFSHWEDRYRRRIQRHQKSRKYRHPIRHWRRLRNDDRIKASTGRPREKDIWLWDEHSGQPSVVLRPRERRQHRRLKDVWTVAWHNLKQGLAIHSQYKALKAKAYQAPVTMHNRLGVCLEVDHNLEHQLSELQATPGLSVLVRCYYHLGQAGLDAGHDAIRQLHEAGHEVALALIQSRQAVLHSEQWQTFVTEAIERNQAYLQFVEVGHAVNRVKWGFWTLKEMHSLWHGIADLKQRFPHLQILGPAVNDFEFHYYPPLLDRVQHLVDGVPNHLYVDRRGQPENFQGRFSSLEKCLYGKAIANVYGKSGFYVTEINWPLTQTGLYSPLAGAYIRRDQQESPLHVSEKESAAYMIRFALIALCSGSTERVWWWRLAHHGFGLIDDLDGWRKRPGWDALVQFHSTVGQDRFVKREERLGAILWHFENVSVVYAMDSAQVDMDSKDQLVRDMTGKRVLVRENGTVTVGPEPLYIHKSSTPT